MENHKLTKLMDQKFDGGVQLCDHQQAGISYEGCMIYKRLRWIRYPIPPDTYFGDKADTSHNEKIGIRCCEQCRHSGHKPGRNSQRDGALRALLLVMAVDHLRYYK